jgi:hypothetical protein
MGVSPTICPGCPWTAILLISASQVARITGMSHWHPEKNQFLSARMKYGFKTVAINLCS